MDRLRGRSRQREPNDRGETLVEVLVSIIILGIAGVAVMTGLMLSVKASDIHRKETNGTAYVRNYAEAIQDWVATSGTTNYKACAGANWYTPAKVGFTVPSGYTVDQSVALAVSPTGATSACGTDTGVQRVTLTVSSTDNRASEKLYVVLRKPCDPSVAACT
jgi:type II secretory pathway pseudopilin PulG